jgi:sugar lactone lactonase YvrE
VQWSFDGPGSISSASGPSTDYTPTLSSTISSPATVTLRASLPNAGLNTTATITVNPVAKPSLGTLEVAITGLPDGTDASVSVAGSNGFNQAATSSRTLSDLEPGVYVVLASDVIANGTTFSPTVAGSPATVKAGETTNASVAYAAQIPGKGALTVNVTGLPDGTKANVIVSGPNSFSRTLVASETISNLEPGVYTVTSSNITANGKIFKPTVTGSPVTVNVGETVSTTVSYAAPTVPPGSLAVSIAGLPDGVNASVSVSGPDSFNQTLAASAILSGLEPGSYTLSANDVTSNSTRFTATVTGSPATIKSGETAIISVSYVAQVGTLQVAMSRLPDGLNADVAVVGPDGFSQTLTASSALSNLSPGAYTITAKAVRQRLGLVDALLDPTVTGSPAMVTVGGTAFSSVNYAQRPGTGLLWMPSSSGLGGFAATSLVRSGSPAPSVALSAFGTFAGVVFDASGNLWAANTSANTLVKFTASSLASSGPAAPTVTISSSNSSLRDPFGLAFDKDGNLWVANSASNTLVKFTPVQLAISGAPVPDVTIQASTTPAGSTISFPRGLAFDKDGNLWVTSGDTQTPGKVVMFTPAQLAVSGSPVPAVTISSNNDNNLTSIIQPIGLAFDANGNLWVANGGVSTISRFTPAQQATSNASRPDLRLIGNTLNLTSSGGIAFDTSGNLWVALSREKAVVRLDVSNLRGEGRFEFIDSASVSVSLGNILTSSLAFDPAPANLPLVQPK